MALCTEDGVFDVLGLNRSRGLEGLRDTADIVVWNSEGHWRIKKLIAKSPTLSSSQAVPEQGCLQLLKSGRTNFITAPSSR